jgi:hypothetical protein
MVYSGLIGARSRVSSAEFYNLLSLFEYEWTDMTSPPPLRIYVMHFVQRTHKDG